MDIVHWQEGIVILLLVLCAGFILKKIYFFFKASDKQKNPCEGCVSGCELRDLYEKKRHDCTQQKHTKKEKSGCKDEKIRQ